MLVVVNGTEVEVAEGCLVAGLLGQLQIGRERVAVEINLEIVPKAAYDIQALTAGDRIEIVQFVGGG